ncbi:MAG: glycosyltransferase family 2 protein [bacterium]
MNLSFHTKLVSIILPTHNRLSLLRITVESILHQNDKHFELIIVNDGSTDGTGDYLDSLQTDPQIRIIHQSNSGPALARNAGITAAKGDIIVFTDDDCTVPPDWTEKIISGMKDGSINIIGGHVENGIEKNIYSSVSQETINYFVIENARSDRSTSFLTSNNIAYRAALLRKWGGFEKSFKAPGGEERALNMKLIARGARSKFDESIVVRHFHAMTLRSFVRQHLNYGAGSKILRTLARKDFPDQFPSISLSLYFRLLLKFLQSENGLLKGLLFIIGQIAVRIGFLKSNELVSASNDDTSE